MKIKTKPSFLRRICFAGSTCVLALALLLGGATRGAAQIFPVAPGDDTTFSIGIFRLMVAPAFRPLLNPGVGTNGYPGYHSSDGRLTSPMMYDFATTIGHSSRHARLLGGTKQVGSPSMGNVGYADYAVIPPLWDLPLAVAGTEEVLTQIRSFALTTVNRPDQGCTNADPRIPSIPLAWPMVKAGPSQGVVRKSLGMVQENTVNGAAVPDFPGRSFFTIFVEVSLPQVPGTFSMTGFPVTGATLYNDIPLVITNLSVASLPPSVVYIHGETTAVPLKFKSNNPPFWNADDVFGYLVLAGHGTITNDCSNEAALVNSVLGPLGTSASEMVVEWPVPTNRCPTPNTTYESIKDDVLVNFNLGAATVRARNFVHGGLGNPITPPTVGNTSFYSTAASFVTLEMSLDGLSWSTGVANGPVQTKITHTSGVGTTGTFDTEMLQLTLNGNGPFGPFMIRESPTKASLGKHTLRSTGQGLLASSFFDVFLDLSVDGGQTWVPADRSIQVSVANPPCGALGAQPVVTKTPTSVIVSWSDSSYRLQTKNALTTPNWSDFTGGSPVTFSITNAPKFFRLICP